MDVGASRLLGGLRAWAGRAEDRAQHRARRNAMLAATDCAARRAEREDVDAYLHDGGDATPPPAVDPDAGPARHAR